MKTKKEITELVKAVGMLSEGRELLALLIQSTGAYEPHLLVDNTGRGDPIKSAYQQGRASVVLPLLSMLTPDQRLSVENIYRQGVEDGNQPKPAARRLRSDTPARTDAPAGSDTTGGTFSL